MLSPNRNRAGSSRSSRVSVVHPAATSFDGSCDPFPRTSSSPPESLTRRTAVPEDQLPRKWRKGPKITLRLIFVLSMCLFTGVPAVSVWTVSWMMGNQGINRLYTVGQDSVETVTTKLRGLLMIATQTAFMELIKSAEDVILTESFRLKSAGLHNLSGVAASLQYSEILDVLSLPSDLRATPNVSMVNYDLLFHSTLQYPTHTFASADRWTVYARLNLDVVQSVAKPTIYLAES
eukprot:RCo040942